MSNNVDGIKKLNEEEIKKSRKILLDYIGEEDKKKEKSNPAKVNRTFMTAIKKEKAVDGVASKKTAAVSAPAVLEKIKSIEPAPTQKMEKILSEAEKKTAREEIKKEEKDEKKESLLKKEKSEKIQKKTPKKKTVGVKKNASKNRKNKKDPKSAKRKKTNEIKKSKQLSFNFGIWEKINIYFKVIGKNFFVIFFIFAVSVILFYLIYSFLLLFFGLDNKVARLVSEYVPVPAVIADSGYLEYYDYVDLLAEGGNDKGEIIEKIILFNLLDKYNISKNQPVEKIISEINNNLLNDEKENPDKLALEEYLDREAANKKAWFLVK